MEAFHRALNKDINCLLTKELTSHPPFIERNFPVVNFIPTIKQSYMAKRLDQYFDDN